MRRTRVVLSGMASKTPERSTPAAVPLSTVVAFSVRMFREARRLTQAELAEKMNSIGFATWSRTTVTEIEGRGRGRNVNFAELVGLASVLRVSLANLVIGGDGKSWDAPIELVPDGLTVRSATELMAMMLPPELVTELVDNVTRASVNLERKHLREGISDDLYRLASSLRDEANRFEQSADRMTAEIEETPS